MNIEHTFLEQIGKYESFPGICLVDTFETAEKEQHEFPFFNPENTERVKRQKAAPIFVVIGNPPYNAHQINENDNNKNRRYEVVDSRVRHTYTKDSSATNKNALSDPYVKAWRWASDRIGKEGVVAYVCNNSFIDELAFDGMRKNLARDFDALYVLNLGGNVRKNPKLSGTTHNVFGIQVGVSINLFVRGGKNQAKPAHIFYYAMPNDWKRGSKTTFLEKQASYKRVAWRNITPDKNVTWLTEGLQSDFNTFPPIALKEQRGRSSDALFRNFSNGLKTNRDDWAWNFDQSVLSDSVRRMINTYNDHVQRWQERKRKPKTVDEFVDNDPQKISWSETLKKTIIEGQTLKFEPKRVRAGSFRPFTRQFVYFDKDIDERRYQLPSFFSKSGIADNRIICLNAPGNPKPFHCLAVREIPDLHLTGDSQCFPFYTYDGEDGARRENIPLSILVQFQQRYDDEKITKWDIFHYVYAVLHHPEYRTRYAANLRRELPRIPFVGKDPKTFHAFVATGKKLADLHVNYEQA